MRAFIQFAESGLSIQVIQATADQAEDEIEDLEYRDDLPETDGLLFKESDGTVRIATPDEIEKHIVGTLSLELAILRRCGLLEKKYQDKIAEKYPIHKQLELLSLGGDELTEMNQYISHFKTQCDADVTAIKDLTTSTDVADYEVNWEEAPDV